MQDLIPRKRGNPAMVAGGPSLNPRGRPRVAASLAAAMRQRFPPERIVELAADLAEHAESEQVRLSALQLIADRAHGKATERHELVTGGASDDDEDLSGLTVDQLRALHELELEREAILNRDGVLEKLHTDEVAPSTMSMQLVAGTPLGTP